MSTVGIDFGTTNSVVGVWSEMGVEVLPIDKAPLEWAPYGFDDVFPSVMARDAEGAICFGWEAKQKSEGKFEAVKRMFADQLDIALDDDGDALAVEEVAVMLFAELRKQALLLGVDANQAVVTVPANSKGRARHRTKISAGMAGFEVLALINEPTAAAMAYSQKHPESRQLLVFDWGGGTLDVTVLQSVDGVFIEQTSSGLGKSGGLDFDSRLQKIVRDSIPGLDQLSSQDRQLLKLEVELAKIRLSAAEATSIQLPNGKEIRITRAQFEREIQGLLNEARIPIERCLRELQIGPGSIDSVVLVGGTCKIPAVRRVVEDIMKVDVDPDINVMTAVGEGAAIAAAILSGQNPNSDFFVCLEHALGTFTFDPLSGLEEFSPIIRKGHKLPAQSSSEYSPIVVTTDSVSVKVVEGDPGSDSPDFTVLKEWDVPLRTPYSEDSRRTFELQYDYDVDGILKVKATDLESGEVLLDDDVSYGVATDKRQLKVMSERAKAAVATGVIDKSAHIELEDPEAMKLIQQARLKVIPFLDVSEAEPINLAVEALESAVGISVTEKKARLKNLLMPYSYLF